MRYLPEILLGLAIGIPLGLLIGALLPLPNMGRAVKGSDRRVK